MANEYQVNQIGVAVVAANDEAPVHVNQLSVGVVRYNDDAPVHINQISVMVVRSIEEEASEDTRRRSFAVGCVP